MKKIIGIIVFGLLITTIFPVEGKYIQINKESSTIHVNKLAPTIEITIQGGWGINVIIKNIGTTDIENEKMIFVLDGSMIFNGYKNREVTFSLEAGKTALHIFPVVGFGATNIKVTIGNTMQTKSGKIFGIIVFGVK